MISNTIFTEALRKLRGLKAVVVGDVMLDAYLRGAVTRISPEAPVPVVDVKQRSCTLGGAANVALNLLKIGVDATVVSVIGCDTTGTDLKDLMEQAGLGIAHLVGSNLRRTTLKTRVMGGVQQMIRLDEEDRLPLQPEEESNVLASLNALLETDANVVVLSDYAKGTLTDTVCQTAIKRCRQLGIPILVDPKGSDFSKYTGATAITPNWSELRAVTHCSPNATVEEVLLQAKALRAACKLNYLFATRGEDGISIVSEEGVYHSPARAQSVFDVSGAGDTVMAVVASCLAANISPPIAVDLANLAASVVVSKTGTVPVELTELKRRIDERTPFGPKVVEVDMASERILNWKEQGSRIVFTNGCFDLLHIGHVTYLRKARELGDYLIVGLNTDASVKRLKGPTRPVVPEQQRAEVLAALESVDLVVLFDDDTPIELIKAIRPMVLCKGADYSEETVVGASEVKSWGGEVRLIDLVEGASSTSLIARANAGKKPN